MNRRTESSLSWPIRIPAGLGSSLLVAGVSLAVLGVCWHHEWPAPPGLALLSHVCAALCLLWSLCALCIARLRAPLRDHPIARDAVAVMDVASMVTGLGAINIMLLAAVIELLCRTLYDPFELTLRVELWTSGMADLAAVAGAVAVGWVRGRNPLLITTLFWLLLFAGLWASALRVPDTVATEASQADMYAIASRWTVLFMFCTSILLAVFTIAGGMADRRRRRLAWPDRLHELNLGPRAWPGFRYSAGLAAAAVLVLGCLFITQPLTVVSGLLAGASALALAARRWEENLADAGIGLMSLAVVSACMFGIPASVQEQPDALYAEIFNRALIGLAVMTWFWHWLAGVWHQQLDDGQAWTTAGRLIRTSHRVGYLLGAVGVLIAVHLAIWPRLPQVIIADDHLWRWVVGLGGHTLLFLALAGSARRTGKATLAWLSLFTVASAVTFILIRQPHAAVTTWWTQHWPLSMPIVALLCLLLAVAAARSRTSRCFAEPLTITGALVAPMGGIVGVLLMDSLNMPGWLPQATFGGLAVVYTLAALRPGARKLLVAAIACAALALWHLR